MQVFRATSYPWLAFLVLVLVLTVAPLLAIGMALAMAQVTPGWVFILALSVAIGFLLSITVAFAALLVFLLAHNEITLRGGTLHIKAGGFHERVPLDAIVASHALDWPMAPAFALARRDNGVWLPGFRVGWYQLGDGSRAFVLLMGRRPAIHIETNQDFCVLLAARDREELLTALHR